MASRKKTMAQRAVGLAAVAMPAPVAKVAGTRWGSRLFILLLPILFATGVLTISWNNGMPTVNFDRARAWFVGRGVGQQVEQQALRVAQEVREQRAPAEAQQGWGPVQSTSWQGQPATPQPQQPVYRPQQAVQPWGAPTYR